MLKAFNRPPKLRSKTRQNFVFSNSQIVPQRGKALQVVRRLRRLRDRLSPFIRLYNARLFYSSKSQPFQFPNFTPAGKALQNVFVPAGNVFVFSNSQIVPQQGKTLQVVRRLRRLRDRLPSFIKSIQQTPKLRY